MGETFDENFWNERYGREGNVWSENPNPQLVAEVRGLRVGTALDAGCGEGTDALWLAGLGWQVTGVDISSVALERAAARAVSFETAGSVVWEHHNLLSWTPPKDSYDLVSAQFMHLPRQDREPLFARLAGAVAPGGTLLIVGHAPSDASSGARRPHGTDLFFTAQQVAATLDPELWHVQVTESRPRRTVGPDETQITIADDVMRAQRRT
ncbi:class I SAM-dependent methyltransferase [Arthrobacter cryoconiti]|uniref:Class I SAM-dependent methyltransferase n=1 Tax=Arthrobacter cryoconiti TaxID=748907 RepID=A0ABV8QX51_9MICC|nr:class I SAM-dependent methyltransferase [Arthrobacter cryoconiti]MCC9068951.1 methyltransferase domain-containing protein [Arthrobacter cryoconiti]